MVLPVVGEGLVEGGIVLVGNFLRLAHPDWLGLVQLLPIVGDFLDLLGLLHLLLLLLVLVNFLDLRLISFLIFLLLFLLLFLIFGVGHLSDHQHT